VVAFVAYDMRQAALAYFGINPSKPAVEFENRLRKRRYWRYPIPRLNYAPTASEARTSVDTVDSSDGRSVLRGSVTLDYRTTTVSWC